MFRFRKWQIYNKSRKLRLEVYKGLIPKISREEKFILIPQVQRAINSVILNIAEGSYRKSDKDFAHFLNQANASLYEFASALDLLLDSKYITNLEYQKFNKLAEELAKQISAFSKHLQKEK